MRENPNSLRSKDTFSLKMKPRSAGAQRPKGRRESDRAHSYRRVNDRFTMEEATNACRKYIQSLQGME